MFTLPLQLIQPLELVTYALSGWIVVKATTEFFGMIARGVLLNDVSRFVKAIEDDVRYSR